MEYYMPKMLDDETCLKIIHKLRNKNLYNANEVSTADMFRLVGALCPEIDESIVTNAKKNYSKLKDGSLAKMYPQALVNLYLESVWWETHGSWNHEKYMEVPENQRCWSTHRKRMRLALESLGEDRDEIQKEKEEFEKSKNGDNLMSIQDHISEMSALRAEIKKLKDDKQRQEDRATFTLKKEMTNMTTDRDRYKKLYEAEQHLRSLAE